MLPQYVGSLTKGDGRGGGTKLVLSISPTLKVRVGFELSHMALEMGFYVLNKRKSQLFQKW